MTQLATKYRPKSLKSYFAQDKIKATVQGLLEKEWPGCVLITGTTGTGKTTLARIIARELESFNTLEEINIGDESGIDGIRELAQRAKLTPFGSRYRVIILDEIHALSAQGKSALLKVLEEPAKTTKFILCTDKPEKLPDAVLGRCVHLRLQQPLPEDIVPYLRLITKKEDVRMSDEALLKIAQAAGGQPREALQCLELVMANPKMSIHELTAKVFGNSNETVAKLIIAVCAKDTKLVLEYWSYLDDKKSACKTLIWILEYCLTKMSGAKCNPRWAWYSAEKEQVYKALNKTTSITIDKIINLHAKLTDVLVLERETTQLDSKLLSVLLS